MLLCVDFVLDVACTDPKAPSRASDSSFGFCVQIKKQQHKCEMQDRRALHLNPYSDVALVSVCK